MKDYGYFCKNWLTFWFSDGVSKNVSHYGKHLPFSPYCSSYTYIVSLTYILFLLHIYCSSYTYIVPLTHILFLLHIYCSSCTYIVPLTHIWAKFHDHGISGSEIKQEVPRTPQFWGASKKSSRTRFRFHHKYIWFWNTFIVIV